MGKEFEDKLVVVTGGSRGIGRGIGAAFARYGANVVLVASSQANLDIASKTIAREAGRAPEVCAADLRNVSGCEHTFEFVRDRHGRCDILINSAGATRAGAFLDLPMTAWEEGFALKFFGAVTLCRLFWPMLRIAKGHVINIAGGAARTPDPEFLIGGSVNSALSNFTKGLSGLGKRDGINVNAILPGMTQTDRVDQLFQQRAEATGKTAEQVRAESIAKAGVNRLGQPEDIAALALFLCSDDARHIQGTAIAVDGGGTPGLH
jgi:NAD(P)-dependent dehydrogenase (short-subunit alcohol dehydrogenase family)